jgi:hypothetical protein
LPNEKTLVTPFKAFAHDGRFGGQEYATRRWQAQHVRISSAATTRLSVSASNPGVTAIRGPLFEHDLDGCTSGV